MKTVNFLLTFFAIYLAVPSLLILLSWNALPGDKLYGVKTGLEKLVMVATSSTPLASKFALQFTERRFSEADKLLAQQGSTIGFTLLAQQAQETKELIVKKQDSETGTKLIEKIENYQEVIGQRQREIVQELPGRTGELPSPLTQPTSTPYSTPSTQQPQLQTQPPQQGAREDQPRITPTPPTAAAPVTHPGQPAQEEVVKKLEDTKEKLEKIKKEIKRELPMQVLERKEDKNDDKDAKD